MNTIQSLPCDVISDLMVAYESGEASPATRKLIEDHLASCATCRAAFASDRPITNQLTSEPPASLVNGQAFVTRTRRLIFAGLTALLLLFALMGGIAMRVVLQDLANQMLPGIPRNDSFYFLFTPLNLVLYLLSLVPSARASSPAPGAIDWLLATVRFILFAALAFGVYQLFALSSVMAASLGALMMVIALAITFLRLPALRYATAIIVTVMILLNVLIAGRTVYAVVQATDFTFQQAGTLGHPPVGAEAEDVVSLDLDAFGLTLQDVRTGTNQPLPLPAGGPEPLQAARAAYSGDGGQVYLTVMQFENASEARRVFQSWKRNFESGVRLGSVENNALSAEGGGTMRFYRPAIETAFSSWQHGSWVTIIEAPGPFGDAMGLARDVKEIVSNSYQSSAD